LYNVTVEVDRQTLQREALAWHDFRALAEDISSTIKAKKRPQASSATRTAPAPASDSWHRPWRGDEPAAASPPCWSATSLRTMASQRRSGTWTRSRTRDKEVMAQLLRRVDGQFADGYGERSVIHNFAVEYVDARTEAIYLRDAGWDAVPLLLERPALVVIAGGRVVAVRDWRGGLTIHPERRDTLNHLYGELSRVEEKAVATHLRHTDLNTASRYIDRHGASSRAINALES